MNQRIQETGVNKNTLYYRSILIFTMLQVLLISCDLSHKSNKLKGSWELYSIQDDQNFIIYNHYGPTTFYYFDEDSSFTYYSKEAFDSHFDSLISNYLFTEDSIFIIDETLSSAAKYSLKRNDTLKIQMKNEILTFIKRDFDKNELKEKILDKYGH